MKHNYKHSTREHGGALLVSVIMIFMMSILGVSAMRGSTIERRMAVNSIVTNKNAQIAESSTEISLNARSNLTAALIANGTSIEIITDVHGDNEVSSHAELVYVGHGIQEGNAIGEGNSTTLSAARFVSRGISRSQAVRADAEIHQGASQPAPPL